MIHVIMFLLKSFSFILLLIANSLHLLVALILWNYKFIVNTKNTYKCIFGNPAKKDIRMTVMFNKVWKSIIGNDSVSKEINIQKI